MSVFKAMEILDDIKMKISDEEYITLSNIFKELYKKDIHIENKDIENKNSLSYITSIINQTTSNFLEIKENISYSNTFRIYMSFKKLLYNLNLANFNIDYIEPEINGDYLHDFNQLQVDMRENGQISQCRNFIKNYMKNTIIYETLKSFLERNENKDENATNEILDRCDLIYQALEKLDNRPEERQRINLCWQIQNHFSTILIILTT